MAITPPASLVQHLREGRCILFAGSGLSAWAKLPTWNALLENLLEVLRGEAPEHPDLEELKALLEDDKQLEVAEYCRDRLPKTLYHETLEKLLGSPDPAVPEIHRLVAELPFAAVVTTNFDRLIESAYFHVHGRRPKTHTNLQTGALAQRLFTDTFFVLKAHGDLDDPDSLVLTSADFRKVIHANPAFDAVMSTLLLTKSVLFVGYSLSDPDFRLLLDRQLETFGEYVPPRHALMSGVGDVERGLLFKTGKIDVLSYPEGQHGQVLDFFRALKEMVEPAAEKLRVRASRTAMRGAGAVEKRPHKEAAQVAKPASLAVATLSLEVRKNLLTSTLSGADGSVVSTCARALPPGAELRRDLRSGFGAIPSTDKMLNEISKAVTACMPQEQLKALARMDRSIVLTLRISQEITAIPWEFLRVDSQMLIERHPVVRASVQISDQARGYPQVKKQFRVLVIGDPMADLAGARREAEEIRDLYDGQSGCDCVALMGADATHAAVADHLVTGGYDIIHFAGHAWLGVREAYLALHDHVRLHAGELAYLLNPKSPAILCLNSHYTAFLPMGLEGESPTAGSGSTRENRLAAGGDAAAGFTEAAAISGVGALVGCFGSPGDDSARTFGVTLHRQLLEGEQIAPALHKARLLTRAAHKGDATWALYTMSGYPDLTLR